MSWFWGSTKSKDATADLDPSLRDFLSKETARQQAAASGTTSSQQAITAAPDRSQPGFDVSGSRSDKPDNTVAQSADGSIPAESLFQDGRYAHLWKTYRPPGELAAATASDHDKMGAILQNMNDRKAAIGRAALENCVMEQIEQEECLRSGSYSKLLRLCKDETRAFNRCYEMQARFLRALGYLSQPRSAGEEERIQMHADKLYHNMLAREKARQEGTAAGDSVAEPLIQADEAIKALGQDSNYARMRAEAIARPDEKNGLNMFTPEARQAILEKLKGMSEDEKQLELQLLVAEARVTRDMGEQIRAVTNDVDEARQQRKDNNQQTLAEKIRGLVG